MRYEWVLFDADHTLFDFDQGSEEALSEVLAMHGIGWEQGMYDDYKRINVQCWTEHEQGLMNRDTLVYERFKRYFQFRQFEHLDPVATQREYLRRLGTKPYLLPGAIEVLETLRGHVKLGYITNGMTEVQRPRMEMIGLHALFDLIVIAGEIGHSKPHRAYFEHVDRKMDSPEPHRVLVVGDSLSADIDGALAYGFHACWFNPEQSPCTLEREPEYTITSLHEVITVVIPPRY